MGMVPKRKRFGSSVVRKSIIAHIRFFPDVYCHNQTFLVDGLSFFCLNPCHGYTPFFGLNFIQLADWFKPRKSIALFSLRQALSAI